MEASVNTAPFKEFTVYMLGEMHSFMHAKISDTYQFYRQLFNYFFDETRLIRYAENKFKLKFEPTRVNFVTLYKHLTTYIDSHNSELLSKNLEDEIISILNDEYTLETAKDGQLHIRLDKMGKIGEFIFCNLLSEYYCFDCIIPKVHLTTDPNMSVFGIDTLFYSSTQNTILFGESKLTKSLTNGIGLIDKSLKDYENQIINEYTLILSNRLLKCLMGDFISMYGDAIEVSLNIFDFISYANVKKICIPIFIAHGTEIDIKEIFNQLKRLKRPGFLGLETQYILISFPIINKSKFVSVITQGIHEKRNLYEQQARYL